MAATNYTPIQLYYSTTASAAPTSGNLASGELAINITDGKLYYKDNGGVVQVIATKGAGTIGGSTTQIQYNNAGALAGSAAMTFNSGTNTTTLTTLNLTNALGATYGGTAQSAYTQGDILYASATNTLSKLAVGTVNYILTSTGSVPQWVAPTSVTVNTATNLAGGAAGSVPYQSGAATTTFLAIGAADRVMTSSGTAPQWVTALTGLTGVSSSSITNTSITSGRVIYATTGGLETSSANLTFDGTTLSAAGLSTTGFTTMVKTITAGNSNFNGTAIFAPATPAKLFIGTGTVTDVTSAASATNTAGAVVAMGITPIAATNASVTYTNASTLYIAGAPSAGANVTITNPYSLYVAAGASYFGGAVTYGAGMTLGGNLLFSPDNTYDIGASGATRPRYGYFGTSVVAPSLSASTSASSNTGPTTGGVSINSGGVSIGYYSAPLTWDIGGGGGNVRMYTSRLGGQGGRFYLDTMATSGTYYNRLLVTETGEFYWYNNNVTTGAQAMSLVSSNLTVAGGISTTNGSITATGVIESYLTYGLSGSANNAGNNGIYWQIRPYSGQSGYLTFTENSVADRWAIGIQPADGTLYFRAGQTAATSVMQVSSGGKLSLATATIYGNANLTIPWVSASSPTQAIYNIDTLTAATYRGAFGDILFKSSSSFANNAAQAVIYLAARNYTSAPGTSNDITQGVGLWIRGYYDNNGAAVPIYLGGYSYNSSTPAMIINQSSNVGIGTDPSYQLDLGNGTTVANRVRLQRGSDDSGQFMTLGWNSISVNRNVALSSAQTDLSFNQVGSNGTRTPLYISSAGYVGVNKTDLYSAFAVGLTGTASINSATIDSVTNFNASGSFGFNGLANNGDGVYFGMGSGGNGIPAGFGFIREATGWNTALAFYTNNITSGPQSTNAMQQKARINSSGQLLVNSNSANGSFNGAVIAGSNASINSASYPGASTYDTGISVNQSGGGGTMLFLCSVNTSAGQNTTSAVYMIQFYYDGNYTPAATLISGSNSWTFGKSGSNTLTVVGPAGNANYAWFGNK